MDSNEHATAGSEHPVVTLDVGAVLANSSLFRMIREGSVSREVIERPARLVGLKAVAEILALADAPENGRLAA